MASNPQHEPTMEEILASIRKIISEDSNEAAPADGPRPQAAPAAAADNDVLELTEEVEAPAPRPVPQPEPVRPAPVAAAMPLKAENDVEFRTIEEPAHIEPRSDDHSDIFSDRSRKAVDETFASIEPDDATRHDMGPMPGIDGRTVEVVFERAVRESFAPVLTEYLHGNTDELVARMKPFIREWMDENFREMLEAAVHAELSRVGKLRGRR